jgi:hypothetical protein
MRSGLQKEGNGPIAPKATKLDQPANLAKIRSSNAVGWFSPEWVGNEWLRPRSELECGFQSRFGLGAAIR